MSTTKERPILFSGAMVRALLDGSKTQTRRVVKPQPAADQGMVNAAYCGHRNLWLRDGPCDPSDPAKEWRCPYGQPGDRLWVRETWQGPLLEEFEMDADADWHLPSHIHQYQNPAHCVYAADGGPAPEYTDLDDNMRNDWRPSIHMFRWASRITLEITSVSVERLQAISRGDAMAEGCPFPNMAQGKDPRQWYAELWGAINGPDSWAANPWVWVVSFKKVTP